MAKKASVTLCEGSIQMNFLMGFQDFFLVIGSSPHHVCFFLFWPEGVANQGTKGVGILAKRYK
jgi:hypothetical protein